MIDKSAYTKTKFKIELLDWICNKITDPFCSFVSEEEHKLCMANDTPQGFMVDNMIFKEGSNNLVIGCKPELLERAKEVWLLKLKVKEDWNRIEGYFRRIIARMDEVGQLYCYVPQFMHKALDEAFIDVRNKSPIPGIHPDPEIYKLISFYVMSRLVI